MIVAKFIPGLNTVAAPLAGSSGAPASRFFLFDGLGALLYAGSFILVGAVFKRQLDQVLSALASLGGSAVAVVIGLLAVYIGYKFYQRQRLLKELRTTRITVDELHQQLEAGQSPIILDLRSDAEVKRDPEFIRGARHVTIDELKAMQHEIPRDREIVLYCSCPNEVTSARMALVLHRNGITRVRPLLGGIDAWRERKYPIDAHLTAVAISAPEHANSNELSK